ncbi:MAG: hypothetical protein M0Q44_01235 [Methylobacter sp.]|jgi:rifampin ADP-ribosylating transferase|nr:hypothetical protein [Methylobacter sp.]
MKKKYYHGGQPGRQKGAFILPPTVTHQKSCSDFGAEDIHRRDRVYLTTDINAALMFSSGCKNGVIYECEPVGEIEDDPDCNRPGLSFQCEKAKVLRLIKPSKNAVQITRMVLAI